MSRDEVIELLKKDAKEPERVAAILDERGVDFDLTAEKEQKLLAVGASENLIDAMSRNGRTRRAARKTLHSDVVGAKLQATMEEIMGLQTIGSERDLDRKLKMAEEFERLFPNSQLMSYVYTQAARALQIKRELERAIEYGQWSL